MTTNNDVVYTPTAAILLNNVRDSEMAVLREEASLSKYAQELSVSDKRRYVEKISGLQDPYGIVSSELSKDVIPCTHHCDA